METLKISSKKARELYPSAGPDFKIMLEETFGKPFFFQKITERVKSALDACNILGYELTDIRPYTSPLTKRQEAVNATEESFVVVEALVEGWVADYSNPNQDKWYPVYIFDPVSGAFRFSYANCADTSANAGCGARHVFPTKELATYFGNQFLPTMNKILIK